MPGQGERFTNKEVNSYHIRTILEPYLYSYSKRGYYKGSKQ